MKGLDKYSILKCPLTTESAMKKIEEINTLVFIVDIKASKQKIKDLRAFPLPGPLALKDHNQGTQDFNLLL